MTQHDRTISAAELTAGLRNHDKDLFQQLYHTYSRELYLLAFRWVQDEGLAKDMVHNLFVYLWEKGHSLTITGEVRHYLFRAVTNRCINELKRRSRTVSEELLRFESDTASFYEIADYIVFQQELLKHLAPLPPRCREIFVLSRVHGLEPAEIAEKLGITLNTVYYQLSVALSTLRTALLPKKKLR
ncbi:RNA polymerase sigma-70 factor, ECF subfamily [Chitinophaga eiseniae]|uniref:RNA polymerase sigma-70 factor, ECF subfamily n=1 Tax=Chitinophaga eiseniae TaxID=634771 RepID=A0A1T4L1D1_9BACT|nr:RNA polymerase sigma-70 factor [Chitinophaga eiseniae]SJZ48453.1 RNA polymerase sigma-70 factor, ECF subfamily [Chitinophaga eiseniae]